MSALHLSQPRAHFPSRRGDGQLKATQGCFHTKLTPSTGSWRPWTHTMTTPKPLPHSLPATAPSGPCPGDSCSLPAAWCSSQLPKQRHGSISSSQNTPCSCQCLTWRDGIWQQGLSTGPGPSPHGQQQYVPAAPMATKSKEESSECNFLMYLQFLSE